MLAQDLAEVEEVRWVIRECLGGAARMGRRGHRADL